MKKINVLLIFKSISILTLVLHLDLTKLYSQDIIGHKKNNPNKKSAIVYKGGLLDTIIQGKSNNIPPSEALAQAGYMRDLTNYL